MSRWWSFYVDYYFPYLYGLMLIEQKLKNSEQEKITKIKKEFTEKIIDYLEEEQIFYIKSEMDEILNIDMTTELQKVLLKEYDQWSSQMEDILEILNQILT